MDATAFCFAAGLCQARCFNTAEAAEYGLDLRIKIKGVCENDEGHINEIRADPNCKDTQIYCDAFELEVGLSNGSIPWQLVHADIFEVISAWTAAICYAFTLAF